MVPTRQLAWNQLPANFATQTDADHHSLTRRIDNSKGIKLPFILTPSGMTRGWNIIQRHLNSFLPQSLRLRA
jgi:hypothetical protein